MEIDITEESGDTIEFELEGVSAGFANSLRRTMVGNVPTLAIEEIRVTRNNSGLFDEILAHRLGMIPWEFDPDNYDIHEECDCDDGCPECEVQMALQKEGPGTITASDISVPSEDVEPAKPETKVADLKEDGELDLEMTAYIGIGQEHAKWQAANTSYSYEDGTFHFKVESVSGLDPRTIVSKAVERLEEDLEGFEESLEENL
ncbi:MAG: DNA-directed RNA polymerase subunit D [Candidatus Nanohaloarchaeota archaeon QJJ-7]|nr:DNA-directed RNA polymerase subunit D [Candidatus Nanohaloarchaeota archaeon QJJ-7]